MEKRRGPPIILADPPIGPTGDYPLGKLNPDDEGGLRIGITNKDGAVIINFGTPVAWFGMPQDQAINFARLIMKKAGVKSVKVIL
jgi:hypothetical protein